jgi:hypothetical protein
MSIRWERDHQYLIQQAAEAAEDSLFLHAVMQVPAKLPRKEKLSQNGIHS